MSEARHARNSSDPDTATLTHQQPSLTRRLLIDVHSHYIPELYREKVIEAGHERPDGMPGLPQWSEASMLDTMDRLGIGTAFLSISSPGVHFGDDTSARVLARIVNDEGARLVRAHPSRFGLFASLPLPDVKSSLDELAFAFDELGADGIVMESNHRGVYPGDSAFEPIFAELDRRQAVLFLHPTSPHCGCCGSREHVMPRAILEFMFETTRAVTNLILSGTLSRYPNFKLIVPHAGAALPILADRLGLAASFLPNMGDLGPEGLLAVMRRFYYDLAGAPVPRQILPLQTIADPSRILYGSDWPFTPEPIAKAQMGKLENYLQTEEGHDVGIWSENALSLFPRIKSVLF